MRPGTRVKVTDNETLYYGKVGSVQMFDRGRIIVKLDTGEVYGYYRRQLRQVRRMPLNAR